MSDVNIQDFPGSWTTAVNGMDRAVGGSYGNVTMDGSNVRIVGNSSNSECDGKWTTIKPGDRILYKAVLQAGSPPPNASGDPASGIRSGIDFYDNTGYIIGTSTPDGKTWTKESGYPGNEAANYAYWNTQKTVIMDFVVQQTYEGDIGTSRQGQPVKPTGILTWQQVWDNIAGQPYGTGWFWATELYINPSQATVDEVYGTSTPTPIPAPTPSQEREIVTIATDGNGTVTWKSQLESTSGGAGTINPLLLDNLTVTAKANTGFQFKGWTFTPQDPAAWATTTINQTNPNTIPVMGNFALTATFTQIPAPTPPATQYTITTVGDGHTNLSPSGIIPKNPGDSLTIHYSASSGYRISAIYVDGVKRQIMQYPNSYTFQNIQANHTLIVKTTRKYFIFLF